MPHNMDTVRDRVEGDKGNVKALRQIRKPLVERKRRARINDSLQELRLLVADADLQSKMENAEVLEVTVKQVEDILQSRASYIDAANREACERFAAGYIQCMHDVHTFVSSCPGIDQKLVAELLNHLLESLPLNEEGQLRDLTPDLGSHDSTWVSRDKSHVAVESSSTSTDDLGSDLDETDSDQSQISSPEEADGHGAFPGVSVSKSLWRPW